MPAIVNGRDFFAAEYSPAKFMIAEYGTLKVNAFFLVFTAATEIPSSAASLIIDFSEHETSASTLSIENATGYGFVIV